jgi:hypothetical protein
VRSRTSGRTSRIAFACWTVAQLGALLVGGVVADRLPRRLVMVGSDLANVCVRTTMGVLLLFGISIPARAGAAAAPNFARELRQGWQAWTEHTWVWLLNAWIALYFLITYAPFFVLGPYIAKHDLGVFALTSVQSLRSPRMRRSC